MEMCELLPDVIDILLLYEKKLLDYFNQVHTVPLGRITTHLFLIILGSLSRL